ncbi:MAG: Tm-1-like ATP-binding domain-containing protein [Woeseiaceae bacterium]
MKKTIALVGSFDTKGKEFEYVREILESHGVSVLTVDFGIIGEPYFNPDVSRESVIESGGGDIGKFKSGKHKDEAMKAVTRGVENVVTRLFAAGEIDGIMGMGGSGGTSVVTAAMRALPVGVPKVMVSTVGGGDVSAYAGTKDIVFVPSIVDVAGLNRISRRIFANAAGAAAGMVSTQPRQDTHTDQRLIAASMFGNTTTAVSAASERLREHGFETLIFHCTGIGGRTMESLIAERQVEGVLDITTTELADFVCGGVFDAGQNRCLAAAMAGVPAVLVPGCVDMANFGSRDSVPQKYQDRLLYEWNPNVTLLRTNVDENTRIGEMIANAANRSTAACAILLPLRGVSMLDSEGDRFWDPEADAACFEAIKRKVRSDIPVIELNHNINDAEFSSAATDQLLQLIEQ